MSYKTISWHHKLSTPLVPLPAVGMGSRCRQNKPMLLCIVFVLLLCIFPGAETPRVINADICGKQSLTGPCPSPPRPHVFRSVPVPRLRDVGFALCAWVPAADRISPCYFTDVSSLFDFDRKQPNFSKFCHSDRIAHCSVCHLK